MGSDLAGRREFLELSLLTGTALIASVHQWPAAAAADTAVHTVSRGMNRDEIHALAQAVEVFSQWDASGHGGLHRKAVIGQLHAMHDALQGRYPPGDYQLLLQTTAELAQLAGFMTWDAGLDAPAQRYYLYALDIAKRAENPGLGAKIIGDMSQLSLGQGKVDDSLALIHAGLAMLPRNGNQLVRSELHGHEACAYARFGKNELTATRRSVDAALEAFDRSTVDDQQPWNDYMDRAEVDGMATAALSRLAVSTDSRLVIPEAHQAEIHAREALAHRPPHRIRSRLFDEVRLSTVRLAQGEPEESAVIAHRVLDQATQMTSTGVLKRLAAHSSALAPYQELSPVADFRSHLTAQLPPSEKG